MEANITELQVALAEGARLVDVREEEEYVLGHVAGSELVPMRTVRGRVEDLRGGQPLYVICEVGARSAVVADFLATQGISAINVAGGMHDWRRSGYPVETGVPR
ncbi:MAG TPA: rhodanese-like domain-containing protein [Actinomycetes bacterium]|nr:rhodanese-like domain-containing protein [Actinomycetes bacterium]